MRAYQAGRRHVKYARAIVGAVIPRVPEQTPENKILSNSMAKSRTKTYTKKRYAKKYRRKLYRRVPRAVQPYSVVRQLKSVQYTSLNPGAGTLANGVLRLNSAFDPTGGLGSGQPLGYDQYASLYQRCAVISWRVKLEICSTDNTNPVAVGFTPLVSITTLSNLNHYKELPGTVSTIITPDIDKVRLYAKGGVKKFFLPPGGKMLTDDTITHGVGSDPSRQLYGHIWAQSMDGSADPATVHIVATLYQTVVFYVPEVPARS